MHAVNAIYDGNTFRPIQPIPVNESYKVVITFIEPITDDASSTTNQRKQPRWKLRGLLKGKVRMTSDFNAPIEDMKEYME